jgi:hypothetical protein
LVYFLDCQWKVHVDFKWSSSTITFISKA